MKITRASEYGILICLFLAQEERRKDAPLTGTAELSYQLSISSNYVQQIMQRLRNGGLVNSVKGPNGGFRLERPASQISMYDIVTACNGDSFEVICESGDIRCVKMVRKHLCPIRTVWYDIKDAVNLLLKSRSLEWLVDNSPQTDELVHFSVHN